MLLIDLVGRRYGCRPSAVIGIPDAVTALDFDAAVAVRAELIRSGETADPQLVKQRQTEGFNAVRALRERIRKSRRRTAKE